MLKFLTDSQIASDTCAMTEGFISYNCENLGQRPHETGLNRTAVRARPCRSGTGQPRFWGRPLLSTHVGALVPSIRRRISTTSLSDKIDPRPTGLAASPRASLSSSPPTHHSDSRVIDETTS